MSEGVRGDALGDAGFADGIANLAGHGVVVKVVAGDSSGARGTRESVEHALQASRGLEALRSSAYTNSSPSAKPKSGSHANALKS